MWKINNPFFPGMLCIALALANAGAHADETRDLTELRATIVNLVDQLVKQGVLTRAQADDMIEKARADATRVGSTPATPEAATGNQPGVVRVPYVPEIVKQEIREQVRSELRNDVVQDVAQQAEREHWILPGASLEWAQRIKWEGDMRLRLEQTSFASDNQPRTYLNVQKINDKRGISAPTPLDEDYLNTTQDRSRLRTRLRLGMTADLSDGVSAGLRLATGNQADPVSTNQTMGSSFRPYQLILDRAFLQYESPASSVYLAGGRMPNPWFSTDLVWDPDVNFDGVVGKFYPLVRGKGYTRAFNPYITLGAFPLQEVELSTRDKWLYATQVGFDKAFQSDSRLRVALAYYDYRNITGQLNHTVDSHALDYTAPQYVQKGNTLFRIITDTNPNADLYGLAADYQELNATFAYDLATFAPTHVVITGDYVKNIGYDAAKVLARTGGSVIGSIRSDVANPLEAHNIGYQLKLTVGWSDTKRAGNWQSFLAFKHLERDAVLDAFTDSDFHLGGTDAEGWILGWNYALRDNVSMALRYISADAIDGPPLGIDTLQVDLNAKF
jgi:hypothetical protein